MDFINVIQLHSIVKLKQYKIGHLPFTTHQFRGSHNFSYEFSLKL